VHWVPSHWPHARLLPVRCCRRRMHICPAAGHVIRIWMPCTSTPHISRTPVIRIECVDSACRSQRSSLVELFYQIQRLHAAACTSTSTQMHAHTTQAQCIGTDGRTRGGRCAMCVLAREEKKLDQKSGRRPQRRRAWDQRDGTQSKLVVHADFFK
jgi:hypothetical protein